MENSQSFTYTYSAKQQQEIDSIRKKYLPKEEDKMETLRKLDRSAEQKGTMMSIIVGVIGALILGGGMSLCMVFTNAYIIPGIIIGIVGMIIVAFAYPVYKNVTRKKREQIAPQILALTEELSK